MNREGEKLRLRQELIAQRSQLPKTLKTQWDQAIRNHVLALPQYREARSIMLFLSKNDEIHTWPLLAQAWADGKTSAVPKVLGRSQGMIAAWITSKEQLVPGPMGIMEPKEVQKASESHLDLIIVPGLAFDRRGHRLGYGAGYYDRFLPAATGSTVGVIYSCFVRDLPVESWDYRVQLVITEKGVLKKGNNSVLTN